MQGIPFPYGVRELGASVEIVRFEDAKETSELSSWIAENQFQNSGEESENWGIIARSKTREESLCLTMTFRRNLRSRLKLQSGRLERVEEEVIEPEIGEFHLRTKEPLLLELYSYGAKQRTMLFASLCEKFGKGSLIELALSKDAMQSLMAEAIEVSSVSLSALGNPFFSDATLAGTDPVNSKTFRELVPSGEIRSFRAKFQTRSEEAGSSPLVASVSSRCKVRFFGGQSPVLQSDIEEFLEKIANIAQLKNGDEKEEDKKRKIPASR